MKKQSLLKFFTLSLGLGAFCATPAAQAAVLSYEPFSGYTVGEELGSTAGVDPTVAGYTGEWTDSDPVFGDAEPVVQSGSLDYTGAGYATETGHRVGVPVNPGGGEIDDNDSGRVYRLFDSSLTVTDSTVGTLYMSFLFQSGQQTGATTYHTLALYNGSATPDANRNFDIGLTTNGGQTGTFYNFGVDNAYTSTGAAANTGVHLLVVRFTLSSTAASDSVTVWVDPTSETGGTTVSGANLTWDRLALSDFDGNSASWDEIRFGTDFASVIPEPSAFTMLLGGLGMLTIFRRRRA